MRSSGLARNEPHQVGSGLTYGIVELAWAGLAGWAIVGWAICVAAGPAGQISSGGRNGGLIVDIGDAVRR
jgi:hypothetical protein